jgi:hypothetical protein
VICAKRFTNGKCRPEPNRQKKNRVESKFVSQPDHWSRLVEGDNHE